MNFSFSILTHLMGKGKIVAATIFYFFLFNNVFAQSPGGVSTGLRTWYKADAITPVANGTDIASWADQATADGTQNAVQNGVYVNSWIGNRQPQYRTAVARYNFNPYLDFTKTYSSLFAYRAHSNRADYRYNYSQGATLYQVGDLTNNQGWFLGTGLGATTTPYSGTNFEHGYPWWGLNQQYYGRACGYYYNTVNDFDWYKAPYISYDQSYNFRRPERKTQNTIPWINSISYDKYGTNFTGSGPTNVDANTALQTRVNSDKWSYDRNYTPAGPSLFIGNELTNHNGGRWWQGGIPEVILYDRKLNIAQGDEADRVDAYLGLKYGITLYNNYYLSDGTKVWDTACNKAFNNQIAGVAKDDASALNQKQSHSIFKKSIVTISVGALNETSNAANTGTITDKYTLIWGTNTLSAGSRDKRVIPGGFAALPSPPACLNSTNVAWSKKNWMVQEQTGKDVGTVKVYIESKEVVCIDWTCQAYIVVGTDANFSNPVYYPLSVATGTTGSTTDYVADINFCEGASNASTTCGGLKSQYFAIAGKGIQIAPGGVLRNLAFWVRADMGTINDSTAANETEAVPGVNSRVREWVNRAKGPSAIPGIAGDAPTLRPATRYDNFNPIVSFQNIGSSSGNTYPSPNENTDPDVATMMATGVLGDANGDYPSTSVADSLSMFSSHRNLINWFNSSIGIGQTGRAPGIFNDWGNTNNVELNEAGASWNPSTNAYTAPYSGTAVPTYNGTLASAQSSSYGRSYSSAAFWWPSVTSGIPVSFNGTLANNTATEILRGNGEQLGIRTAPDGIYNLTQHNNTVHRGNVALAGATNDYGGNGIQDAILYSGGFNAADFEIERIETYLGIRNGITMLHNYYATDKTLLWDTTAIVDAAPNAPNGYTRYNKSITGIGRDDAELLNQRVSRNAHDTAVTISLGLIPENEDQRSVDADFVNDKEYIIWGSNGGTFNTRVTTDMPSPLPGCIDSRVNREYHVKLTGANTGNYKTQVRWQLDNNLLDPIAATSIALLIDDDGDGNFATGNVRVIPATTFDLPTNSALFDNVAWTVAGDAAPADAVMTIGWVQVNAGRVVLYNGTATGGGNCTCAGAVSALATTLCTDANGWTFYKNPVTGSNNKVVAINWGTNTVTANVTLDASTPAANRRKVTLNTTVGTYQFDSAAIVGARMLNVTLTSGTLTAPVKVRFYYDINEIKTDSTWIIGSSSGVGNGGGVNKPYITDSTWSWFKYEGTIANVLSSLTASGLPLGDGTTAGTYSKLMPDESGVEDGVRYVQFNYITNFSTIGYLQTFVKNNDITVLPLRLLDFSAQLSGSTTNLAWTTDNEVNINYFEVERSTDAGRTFNKTTTVFASTSSNSVKDYLQTDDVTGLSGKVYYRLKIVDKDGRSYYSPIRFIVVNGKLQSFDVAPNPVSQQANVLIQSTINEQIDINVLSFDGKLVYSTTVNTKVGGNVFNINVANLAAGTYAVQIVHQNGLIDVKKIIKN